MDTVMKACREAATTTMRNTMPMTARWTLHNTLPKLAAKAVEVSFYPGLIVLATLANLAVANRKRIVGM